MFPSQEDTVHKIMKDILWNKSSWYIITFDNTGISWKGTWLPHLLINSPQPGQNDGLFADDIFRCILVNEKGFFILVKISMKFLPEGPINNNTALVQIMAWCWIGNKPLYEPMLTCVGNSHSSASQRPTTFLEDWELFVDFSSILCLWFEIQDMRTYNLLTEFQTLMLWHICGTRGRWVKHINRQQFENQCQC